jgi:hypothetical protein
MSDPVKHAWSEVGDGFATLGRVMREHYQTASEQASEEVSNAQREAGNAFNQAIERLLAAGREVGDRAADVVRDDDVKDQAKHLAASLNEAINATVDLIGEQVGGLFSRTKGTAEDAVDTAETPPAVPASEPPADDARQ